MRRAVLLVAALVVTALAAGFQVQSYLSEAVDKHSIEISAPAGGAKLWFNLPPRTGITVTATPDSGAATTAKLAMTGPVDLKGAGDIKVTVTRDSGAGKWTVGDLAGGPVLTNVKTWVDPEHGVRLVIKTDDDEESWKFSYPRGATFLVRQVNAAGKVVEEQDLWDSDEVELVGGGSFTLDVVSTDGEGELTATLK